MKKHFSNQNYARMLIRVENYIIEREKYQNITKKQINKQIKRIFKYLALISII